MLDNCYPIFCKFSKYQIKETDFIVYNSDVKNFNAVLLQHCWSGALHSILLLLQFSYKK